MNKQQFEDKYKELIPHVPLEDIKKLFEQKKMFYLKNNFFGLLYKVKNFLGFKKQNSILYFGYKPNEIYLLIQMLYDEAIKYHRVDMINYIFQSDYFKHANKSFYLEKIFDSEKVFADIVSDEKFQLTIKLHEYAAMLKYCSKKNLPNKFDIICDIAKDQLQLIEQHDKNQIILFAAQYDSVEMLKKLLHMKEPFIFDIDTMDDDRFTNICVRENLLTWSVRNKNLDMIKYLLTSSELEKNIDLAKSFYWLEVGLEKEIIDFIIFDVKAPLTKNLEKLLEKNFYLEVFKKRDLMLKIENKLPAKNEKTKVKKI